MSFLLRKIQKWAEDEDDELWNIYNNLYGPMYWLSAIFPSWRPSKRALSIGIIAVYFFTFLTHGYLLSLSVVLLRDDMELASLNFHYWIIFSFSIVGVAIMNKNRAILASTHRLMGTDLGQYKARRIYKERRPLELIAQKKKQTIQFLFLPGLVLLIAAGVLVIPYVQKINREATYTSNGVNMNLPIAAAYPFQTDKGLLHFLAILGQLMTGAGMSIVLITLELTLFRIGQQVIFEYKVLRYAIETILKSAEMLYKQIYGDRKLAFSNDNFQHCIGECLKELVAHHHRIGDLLYGYECLLKWPIALAYFCGTGVIGLSLINIQSAKDSANYENMVLFSLLATAEVLNMYIISMFGEAITTECKILRDQLYFVNWRKLNVCNRRMLLNFQVGITNPVIVKVGGLVDMSMDTFSSIINTSYSFFNLLNAS